MDAMQTEDYIQFIPVAAIHERIGSAKLCRDRVEEVLRSHGYVLLRGFAKTVAEYEAITRQFARRFRVHGNPKRRWFSADGLTQQVDPGRDALPPHSEMSYNPHYPDTLWFYCVRPSHTGGETTVCDGVAVYDALRPDIRRLFHEKRLEYRHHYTEEAWSRALRTTSISLATVKLWALALRYRYRGPLKFAFEADRTLRICYQPWAIVRMRDGRWAYANSVEISALPQYVALRGGGVSFEGGGLIPPEVTKALALTTEALSSRVPWVAGDVLMIDNERTMHGRVALPPGDREIYLRLGDRFGPRWA